MGSCGAVPRGEDEQERASVPPAFAPASSASGRLQGAKVVSHRVSHEHHPEVYAFTISPNAIRINGTKTTSVGEAPSDDGHGGPVVFKQVADFTPSGQLPRR